MNTRNTLLTALGSAVLATSGASAQKTISLSDVEISYIDEDCFTFEMNAGGLGSFCYEVFSLDGPTIRLLYPGPSAFQVGDSVNITYSTAGVKNEGYSYGQLVRGEGRFYSGSSNTPVSGYQLGEIAPINGVIGTIERIP